MISINEEDQDHTKKTIGILFDSYIQKSLGYNKVPSNVGMSNVSQL